MAIYHLTLKAGSRSSGKSAGAKCNYINKQGRYAKNNSEVTLSCSENLPAWAKSSHDFWTAADNFERKNACIFKEIEFSLPAELSEHQQQKLALSFAKDILKKQPFSLAIHDKKDGNPHCHLMFSERANDGIERTKEQFFKRANNKKPELGGAKKNRALNSKNWLKQIRPRWQEMANSALKRAGHNETIDHRSLEDQGVNRAPQIHIGVRSWAMRESAVIPRRVEFNNSIKMLNSASVKVAQDIKVEQQNTKNEHENTGWNTVISTVNKKKSVPKSRPDNVTSALTKKNKAPSWINPKAFETKKSSEIENKPAGPAAEYMQDIEAKHTPTKGDASLQPKRPKKRPSNDDFDRDR